MLRQFGGTVLLATCIGLVCGMPRAVAEQLSDLEIYQRCYVRMVRMVPDSTDPILIQVQNGRMKGADACLALFDSAAFDTTGVLKNRMSDTARRVVKTFNDLHRTWFESRLPAQSSNASQLISDLEEPALYYTRAAFQPVKFSSVVTLEMGLQGVRDRDPLDVDTSKFKAQRFVVYPATASFAAATGLVVQYNHSVMGVPTPAPTASPMPGASPPPVASATPPPKQVLITTVDVISVPDTGIVDVGTLVGVKPANSLIFPSYLKNNDATVRTVALTQLENVESNAHFGGGIIGSQGFLNANYALAIGQLPVDATYINRRITSRVFQDLLCEQLPTLNGPALSGATATAQTADDVSTELDLSSTYPFRHSTSCLQCHSSIDNAAYTLRNIFAFRGGPVQSTVGLTTLGLMAMTPVAGSTVFSLQAPTGRLHYRENLSKNLVDLPLSSIADFGAKLAGGNDLYLCAAQRYYRFLTGINVDLRTPAVTPFDVAHQSLVVKLGQDLKTTQSVRALLSEIFNSPQFTARDYMVMGGK